jgi:branched-chain amino acid aminotransferase
MLPSDLLDPVPKSTLRAHIVERLRTAILAGDIPPGASLVETCNSTNFFIVRGRELWTSTSLYSFKGITQQNVLDAWRAAGNVARECDFTLAQVYSADEAFVTGTLGGVTPVTKVDGRLIAGGKAGKVTKVASDLYLKSVGAV